MIPKIIHYSWISGEEFPEKMKKCIESWKKYMPDYQFVNWNKEKWEEEGIDAVWLNEAYSQRKYAFCADFLRVYAVHKYGGFYLDCDVEVFKSFNELCKLKYYISLESTSNYGYIWQQEKYSQHNFHFPEGAVFGGEPNCDVLKPVFDYYNTHHYEYKSIPKIMRECWLTNNFELDFDYRNIEEASKAEEEANKVIIMDENYFSYENEKHENAYYKHHFTNTWC